jgi:uncharacterized RDD family membrane protein YckC
MTELDLTDFASSSEKIPKSSLLPAQRTEHIARWKIAASLLWDSYAVIALTVLMTTMLHLSVGAFMITDSLQRAYDEINFNSLYPSLLPIVMTSYFFFSFFFNQGQTWGMRYFKTRVSVANLDLKQSLQWAIFSCTVICSAGLALIPALHWMEKKGLGTFKKFDHLYEDLIEYRDIAPVNLVAITDEQRPPVAESSYWDKVA